MESEERINIMGKRRKDSKNRRAFLILIQNNIENCYYIYPFNCYDIISLCILAANKYGKNRSKCL